MIIRDCMLKSQIEIAHINAQIYANETDILYFEKDIHLLGFYLHDNEIEVLCNLLSA